MKIERLLLGLFASFLMVGCSQNDDLSGNAEEQGNDKKSYVAVEICSPKTLGSRATDADDFADAVGDEGIVTNAHFFFYNDNGDPVNINQGKNYVTKSLTYTSDNDDNGSTESTTETVVVLEKPDVYPTRMAVVLNWNYSGASLTLNETTGLAEQSITKSAAIEQTTGFIMSSSVYYDGGIVNYAKIDGSNFGATPSDAQTKPVKAYVERLAAKVTASLKTTSNDANYNSTLGAFKTGVTYKDASGTEKPIFARILGWQINTTNPTSYLLKKLDSQWGTNAPFTDWNESDKRRSYWGISSTPATYENIEFTYNGIGNGFDGIAYCLENTTSTTTKAVFKAEIGTENSGTFAALDIWQWYGKYFLDQTDMMNNVLEQINSEVEKKGSTVKLTSSDIELAYSNDNQTSYQITFKLKSTVQDVDLDSSTKLSDIVEGTEYAKHWHNGQTYYFTSIKHLNNEFAVIRNHAYQLQVTEVKGLGTPVNENPIPEIPEPIDPGTTETYIAAQINVLSWRLVSNDVTLGQ